MEKCNLQIELKWQQCWKTFSCDKVAEIRYMLSKLCCCLFNPQDVDDQKVAEKKNGSDGYATVTESEYSSQTSKPLHGKEEQIKGDKIEEQIHIDV